MVEEGSDPDAVISNPWRISGMPAVPRKRAQSDQPKAASVPMDTRVSIVAAPCRRFVQAARWKGSPPQTTTGAARVRESHCQLSNWRAGTMAIRTTGTASTAETWRRCRSAARAASARRSAASPGSSPLSSPLSRKDAAPSPAESRGVPVGSPPPAASADVGVRVGDSVAGAGADGAGAGRATGWAV